MFAGKILHLSIADSQQRHEPRLFDGVSWGISIQPPFWLHGGPTPDESELTVENTVGEKLCVQAPSPSVSMLVFKTV